MTHKVKRPAFQFYPRDWLGDTALRSCSVAARGLWADMLSYMHEGEPYGYLRLNNRAITADALARMVGESPSTVKRLLKELEQAGVPSVDDDGAFYSRRMVRDERLRTIRAEAGSKGGNPNLLGLKDNGLVNQRSKQTPTPASADADADASADASNSGSADPLADAAAGNGPLPPGAIAILARMPSSKRADGRRQLLASLTSRGAPMPKGDAARAHDVTHLEWCCREKLRQFDEKAPDKPGMEVLFVLYLVRDTLLEWRANVERTDLAPAAKNGTGPQPPLSFGQELERARDWAQNHREQLVEIEREAATRFGTDPSRQRDRWCDEQLIDRWRAGHDSHDSRSNS